MAQNQERDQRSLEARRREFILRKKKEAEDLKKYGYYFIMKFVDLYKKYQPEVLHAYTTEVLHCIFFLGHMRKIEPTDFFETNGLISKLQQMFPDPFEKYKTHLPTRTPFSIILDAIVHIKDNQHENKVMDCLVAFLKDVKLSKHDPDTKHQNHYTLEATVICICHYEKTNIQRSNNFYGASLSCKGKVEQEVMIAVSCLETWNAAVAHAVSLADNGGAIMLPKTVKCSAFKRNWRTDHYFGTPPCKKCITIFQGPSFKPCQYKTDKEPKWPEWPYGNCAETESLSKLLNAEPELYQQVKILKNNSPANLERVTVQNKAKQILVSKLEEKYYVTNGNEVQFQFFKPPPSPF
ncbi:uncharacterized protein LOC121296625 [Polyodon spathula]|uniref:uncharacterized protein LOC121296625 n=1 Tax=Polyodon spathula TaxID=7913 RepID=UPI001B7DAC9B|nr:uncharacterized protein LOC121296625 [Polyodon spathula]